MSSNFDGIRDYLQRHRRTLIWLALIVSTGWAPLTWAWWSWNDIRDEVQPPVGVYEAPPEQKLADLLRGEGPPLIFAHRGDDLFAGQNSLEAFERALHRGYDGVELDVVNTKDDVPIVSHNLTVGPSGGRMFLPETTVAEAQKYAETMPEEQGHRLRTLDDVLARFARKIVMVVEIKADKGDGFGVVEPTCRLIKEHGAQGTVILSSLTYEIIDLARDTEACRDIAVMYEWSKTGARPPADYGLPLIGVRHDLLEDRKAGLPESVRALSVYTPNWTFQIERAIDLGVLLIQTDHPSRAMRIRKEMLGGEAGSFRHSR